LSLSVSLSAIPQSASNHPRIEEISSEPQSLHVAPIHMFNLPPPTFTLAEMPEIILLSLRIPTTGTRILRTVDQEALYD
jgi:hypothetical protein